MTKFADQLFDDLMDEHGPSLARTEVPAPRRRLTSRSVLLTAGAAGAAVAATIGVLASGGSAPAFAATAHPNGTVTLAVYDKSGYAGINAKLRQDGDSQVIVVPVQSGCPLLQNALKSGQGFTATISNAPSGGVTVSTTGLPDGDLLVIGLQVITVQPYTGRTFYLAEVTLASDPTPTCLAPAHLAAPSQVQTSPPGTGPGELHGHKAGESTQSHG